MKIHEYQAKSLLKQFDVPVLPGGVAYTPEEAREAARAIGGSRWVVKAQIHAGGRGKGGGIQLAASLEEVVSHARALLGKPLITPQTGPGGQKVTRLYIEQAGEKDMGQELYVSFLVDRKRGCVTAMVSTLGGGDIEAAAAHSPQDIHHFPIHPLKGFQSYQTRHLAFALGLKEKTALKTAALLEGLYKAFIHYDASLLEVNPLVITKEGSPVALDAKMILDDNALYRHPEIEALRDPTEEDPLEREATQNSLSYIKLEGNIGCLVNGAGLAMATMDAIKLYGGEPANFLDVGGGAPRERVTQAFKILMSDANIEGILVNIFGGIMRCDVIAEGIVAAIKDVGIHVPLVVRLEGTNSPLGQKILKNAGLPILAADELGSAAQQIVEAVKGSA